MKHSPILMICAIILIAGCKQKLNEAPDQTAGGEESQGISSKPKQVEMLPPAQNHVGMVIAPAEVVQLTEYFRATGTVQPIDSHIGEVSPLSRGRVVELRASVGDRVRAGQALAVFDNIEAVDLSAQEQSAKAELASLSAKLTPATRQTQRSRRLADIGAGAEKDYEFSKADEQGIRASIQSQQAVIEGIRQRLRRYGSTAGSGSPLTVLKAPFAGVVTKAQVSAGDTAEPGKSLFTIADLSRVWVQAEVYEKDLGRIRPGQDAAIRVDTYPNEIFLGRVAYISDVLDPQTRTARVRCEVDNREMRLKTDMFANIELPTKFSKRGLAVPSSALQDVEGKSVVFVQTAPTKFEARQIEKGVSINGSTEIVSGLTAGERVVTQGAFHLKSILAGGELGED